MKKLIVVAGVLLCGMASSVLGQNFTYTSPAIELQGTLNTVTIFHSNFQNLEAASREYRVIINRSLLPATWAATFCVDTACYSPFTDTVTFTALPNGLDTMTTDITPLDNTNDGWVTMTVEPMDNPGLAQSITFHLWQFLGVKGDINTPEGFGLLQAYPNPFNATLALTFNLDHPADADLAIYDLKGARVARIFEGSAAVGEHRFNWNPGNLASGIYLVKLNAGLTEQVQKVVYLR
jgi:hypothetical protein